MQPSAPRADAQQGSYPGELSYKLQWQACCLLHRP